MVACVYIHIHALFIVKYIDVCYYIMIIYFPKYYRYSVVADFSKSGEITINGAVTIYDIGTVRSNIWLYMYVTLYGYAIDGT